MLSVCKFGGEYVVWDLDDLEIGRPIAGRDAFHKSAANALEYYALRITDATRGIPVHLCKTLKDIEIEADQNADKTLIEKYGFTAA